MQVTILTSAEDVKRTWGREFVVVEERRETRFGRRRSQGRSSGEERAPFGRIVPYQSQDTAAVEFPGLQHQYTWHPAEEKRTARNHPAKKRGMGRRLCHVGRGSALRR